MPLARGDGVGVGVNVGALLVSCSSPSCFLSPNTCRTTGMEMGALVVSSFKGDDDDDDNDDGAIIVFALTEDRSAIVLLLKT